MVKTSCKWLKTVLASKIKKFDPAFLMPNLGEFPYFDKFFLNLADFWDLNKFWPFNFDNFLFFGSANFSINLLALSILLTFLVVNILLTTSILNLTIVFSIDLNDIAILLKYPINF